MKYNKSELLNKNFSLWEKVLFFFFPVSIAPSYRQKQKPAWPDSDGDSSVLHPLCACMLAPGFLLNQ